MIVALILLCMDGFYVFNPMIKLSHIGSIMLLFVCLTQVRSKFRPGTLVILLGIIALGALGSLLSSSSRNFLYFLSQIGLLTTCVLIFWASSNQKLTPAMLHRLAQILIVGSFSNYFVLLTSGADFVSEFSSLIGIDSSTSRLSLETAFGARIPRMYFLSSEPSTHAITVVCLYVALVQNSNLSKPWILAFFVNVLCTFSLTGILLFLSYNLWMNRNIITTAMLGGLVAMVLIVGAYQFSTANKLFNLLDSPRVDQFSFVSSYIDHMPRDINSIPDVETNVFSLWLYVLMANGTILSALMFLLLLFLGNNSRLNRVLFFLIFLVVPISYFTAASLLTIKRR